MLMQKVKHFQKNKIEKKRDFAVQMDPPPSNEME